jgi:branched-chain amino acid transport system substrate-binding protein
MVGMRKPLVVATALAVAVTTAACGGEIGGGSTSDGDTLVIGYVSPATGPLAPFGEADAFAIEQMNQFFKQNPLQVGDTEYDVEIIVKDAASDSSTAAEVTGELINSDGADLILASSTPDITNPVSEQCEANSVPCITTVAPWQPFAIRHDGGEPADLRYSYHFFWGLEDVAAVYSNIWKAVGSNGKVGGLFPNDPDGQAWSANFPSLTEDSGVDIQNPGLYPNGTKDFSAQIARYKDSGDEVLLGVPIPPDFTTFWKQAAQQGYRPRVATIGKALLFPSSVEALGPIAQNLSTEVWWTPTADYISSLTGQSAQELADAYTEATGKRWTQPLGFSEALFEVATAAVKAAGSTDADDLTEALSGLDVDTIVGNVAFGAEGLPRYIAKTPLAGGQWREGEDGWDLVVVENSLAPDVPVAGEAEALED